MSMLRFAWLHTPIGRLTVVTRGETAVAAGFVSNEAHLLDRFAGNGTEIRSARSLGAVTDALSAYFDGDVFALDGIPVEQPGTPFRDRLWREMRKVPPGQTISYTTLARRAGRPGAVRAAGTTCGANLVAPIVPCHRIVRSDGKLGGYGYGVEKKSWLLDHERRAVS